MFHFKCCPQVGSKKALKIQIMTLIYTEASKQAVFDFVCGWRQTANRRTHGRFSRKQNCTRKCSLGEPGKRQQGCISGFLLVLRWFDVSVSRLSMRISSLPSSVYKPLPNIWLLVFGSLSEYKDTDFGRGVSVRGRPCVRERKKTN